MLNFYDGCARFLRHNFVVRDFGLLNCRLL